MLEKRSASLTSSRYWFRIFVSTNNTLLHYHFSPTPAQQVICNAICFTWRRNEKNRETQCSYRPWTFLEKAGSVGRLWTTVLVRMAVPAGSPAGDNNRCLRFATFPLKWVPSLAYSKSNLAVFGYSEKGVKSALHNPTPLQNRAMPSVPAHLLDSCV